MQQPSTPRGLLISQVCTTDNADVNVSWLYSSCLLGIVMFTGLVKLPSKEDYWDSGALGVRTCVPDYMPFDRFQCANARDAHDYGEQGGSTAQDRAEFWQDLADPTISEPVPDRWAASTQVDRAR
jgi:hypothetical protein